jgi:hypothetical protein
MSNNNNNTNTNKGEKVMNNNNNGLKVGLFAAGATASALKFAFMTLTFPIGGQVFLPTIWVLATVETGLFAAIFTPAFVTAYGVLSNLFTEEVEELSGEDLKELTKLYGSLLTTKTISINAIPVTNTPETVIPNITKSDSSVIHEVIEASELKREFDARLKAAEVNLTPNSRFGKTFNVEGDKVTVGFNYGDKTLTISRVYLDGRIEVKAREEKVYNTRNYVVLSFEVEGKRICGLYNDVQALTIVASEIKRCVTLHDAEVLITSLISKIFLDRGEQETRNGQEFYGRRNKMIKGSEDQQAVIEAHKVSLVGIFPESLKLNVKEEFNGREIDAVSHYFALIGEPVITDKVNKKYFVYGDGARACGVDLVDGELVTINPIDLEKAAKTLNRMISHSFLKASNVALLVDEVSAPPAKGGRGTKVSQVTTSNLHFGLSNGRKVAASGVEIPVFIHTGAFNLDNGILQTNALVNVRFAISQTKALPAIKLNLGTFSAEYLETLGNTPKKQLAGLRKAIAEFITELTNSNPCIKANAIVRFQDVVVVANPFHYDVNISQVNVKLGAADFNHQIRSLVVEVKGVVNTVKKSPKVRSLTKKATAYQTHTIITDTDSVVQPWTAILNREAIKGSSAILDIYANANLDETFVWSKGVLTVNGEVRNLLC